MAGLKDTILRVFRGEKVDELPWFCDLTSLFCAENKIRPADINNNIDAIIKKHKEYGCCFYMPPFTTYSVEYDCKKEIEYKDDVVIKTYFTPSGQLREVIRFLPDYTASYHEEYLVKSSSDLNALQYLCESVVYSPDYGKLNGFEEKFSDVGIALELLPQTPLSRLVNEYAGVQSTAFAAFESPEEFNNLIDTMCCKDDAVFDIVMKSEATFSVFPDCLSGDVISPRLFSQFSMDYYKYRNEQLHTMKKLTFAQMHGASKKMLPIIAETGIDCIEGIQPAPAGDVKPSELRGLTNDNIILWGGLPADIFQQKWRVDSFELFIFSYWETMRTNPRFILSTANPLFQGTDYERIKRVSEMVQDFKY